MYLLALISFFSLAFNAYADDDGYKKVDFMDDQNITIATGSSYGVYYPIGSNICRLINHNKKNFGPRCKAKTSFGSFENLSLIAKGEVDIAIVQSDWLRSFINSFENNNAAEKPGNQLKFVMSLQTEELMLLVRRNSKIKSIDQLQNAVVSSGTVEKSVNVALSNLLDTKGIGKNDIKIINSLNINDQSNALCNGSIDVLVLVSGEPNSIISETASTCEISILPIDDSTIAATSQRYPDLFKSSIKAGMYPGVNKDIQTLGTKALLLTNSSVSEKIVYGITKTIMENLENLKKVHPSLEYLTPEEMISTGQNIETHPGAAMYYKEKGYIK